MEIGRYVRKALKAAIKWAVRDDSNQPYPSDSSMPMSVGMASTKSSGPMGSNSIGSNGMHFTVYGATGGKVIETRTYDPRTDRSNTALYVITDKEDLGEELGQIITKESLCR